MSSNLGVGLVPARKSVKLLAALALTGSLVASGCGNRSSKDDLNALLNQGTTTTTSAPTSQSPEPITEAPAAAGSDQGSASAAGATPGAGVGSGAGTATTARPATGTSAPSRTSAAAPAGSKGGPKAGQSQAGAPGTPPPIEGAPTHPGGQAGAPCTGSEPPIRLGSVGIHSGLVGQLFVAAMQALKAGITEVNASGGINCHKLELITGDDGNDPARHQALIREFVEKRGVIAFVFNAAPFSGQSSVEYVTQKSVPVIGSKGGSRWFYQSPMFFPLGSSGDGLARASVQGMANYALPQGKKKTAVITCQEVEYCFLVDKAADDLAGKVGLDVVYKAKATLTQPDYTAECIQARNAGAETIITAFDGGSDHRLMASCAKVGFRPPIVASNAQAQENFKDDPNLQGSLIVMNALPWVVDHPAIAEYRRVIQKQTGKPVVESPSGMLAWQAVKGFELAARAGVQPGNATPTSAEILKGLYTLNGTDIAGLAPKQEIIRGKAPRLTSCGWNVIVGKGSYKSDGKMFCVQGETP